MRGGGIERVREGEGVKAIQSQRESLVNQHLAPKKREPALVNQRLAPEKRESALVNQRLALVVALAVRRYVPW